MLFGGESRFCWSLVVYICLIVWAKNERFLGRICRRLFITHLPIPDVPWKMGKSPKNPLKTQPTNRADQVTLLLCVLAPAPDSRGWDRDIVKRSLEITKPWVVRKQEWAPWLTLQEINISHLGKRKIIFKMPFLGDMLVSWRVTLGGA